MSEGWKCPGCGKCYSPAVPECGTCGKVGETTTIGGWVDGGAIPCPHSSVIDDSGGRRCGLCGMQLLPTTQWTYAAVLQKE